MTRVGFFLFNMLLVVFVYGLVWLGGAQPGIVRFALQSFSEPYIVLILLMTIFNTLRWFMFHNDEVAREIVTWANALWVVPVMTALALYFLGGTDQFNVSLKGLMTLR